MAIITDDLYDDLCSLRSDPTTQTFFLMSSFRLQQWPIYLIVFKSVWQIVPRVSKIWYYKTSRFLKTELLKLQQMTVFG